MKMKPLSRASVATLLLFALLFLVSCGGDYKKIKKNPDPNVKYNAAVAFYKAGSYLKALPLFEELLSVYRGTNKAEEISYYYAYTNYYLEDYVMAQFYFTTFYRSFPHSPHAEECEFMRAFCGYLLSPVYSLDQADTRKAIEAFQTFVDDFPNSVHVKESNKYIDMLRGKLEKKYFEIAKQYYTIEYYNAAGVALRNYLKAYPDSRFAEESNFLIVEAEYKYAINSIQNKKGERLQKVLDDYARFVAQYPNSQFMKKAQNIYESVVKIKAGLIG